MSRGPETFTFETSVSVTSEASPEVVYEVIRDLRAHLEWSGERASDDSFKLLEIEAPDEPATVGTTFTSTGANFNGTFHDSSTVIEASPPNRFAIETDARLDRTHGRAWEVRFTHRYFIAPQGVGSRIVYTDTARNMNYIPYWLRPWMRPITRMAIRRGDTKQLSNLARLAEERSAMST